MAIDFQKINDQYMEPHTNFLSEKAQSLNKNNNNK